MPIAPDSARLVIIGGGNMAGAIVRGAVAAGVLPAHGIIVCELDEGKCAAFEQVGVRATASHAEAIGSLAQDGQILLAVKPQMLATVVEQVRHSWPKREVIVITVLAGMPTTKIRTALGNNARLVRAMPNIAASVGRSATALCLGAGGRPGDDEFAMRLFQGVGSLVVRINEDLMDAFTAVASSGLAYVFYLAEGMMKAAQELGFDAATADKAVRETIAGAAALLTNSPESPGALRAAVTSKGGTTEAAARVLDSRGVMDAIVAALTAARDRGRELSK
jgi:pyrroline-5-carboxylate reductase